MTAQGTAIEWTHIPGFKGETWNPVTGCDRISPGCAHCYARTQARRLKAMGQPHYQRDGDGPGFGVSMHRDSLEKPERWTHPRAVFVNSMSDLFHDEVDEGFIRDVYSTVARTPQHIYMVLTKRPERARRLYERGVLAGRWVTTWPLPNLWLGVSVESSRFTWRADVLREIPAAVRFVSAEPLLGSLFQDARDPKPLELTVEERRHVRAPLRLDGIDWVIVGGESGHGARPMHPDWALELRDACLTWPDGAPFGDRTGPAFFFKQWGAWADGSYVDGDGHVVPSNRNRVVTYDGRARTLEEWQRDGIRAGAGHARPVAMHLAGKHASGRELDFREWSEFPTRQEVSDGR